MERGGRGEAHIYGTYTSEYGTYTSEYVTYTSWGWGGHRFVELLERLLDRLLVVHCAHRELQLVPRVLLERLGQLWPFWCVKTRRQFRHAERAGAGQRRYGPEICLQRCETRPARKDRERGGGGTLLTHTASRLGHARVEELQLHL